MFLSLNIILYGVFVRVKGIQEFKDLNMAYQLVGWRVVADFVMESRLYSSNGFPRGRDIYQSDKVCVYISSL